MANKGILKQLQEELSPNGGEVNQLGGLHTDSSLVNQPQGTTRFVLNGVNETTEGDFGFIANEESNEICYDLTASGTLEVGYIPIGKVYVGNEETVLFLANPNGNSAIVLIDRETKLSVLVSDKLQPEKLGFRVSNQIDATYRLRRGCERTVYWVDPKPRLFVIEKPEDFINKTTGYWELSKFSLFKTYKKIPVITDLKALDGAGSLPPGSYNFSMQYLDEDFNPTEFITSTETVNIYNSPLTDAFKDIRGSTKETNTSYLQFTDTNKAIKIEVDPTSMDTNFPFYRWAITEANSGLGLITDTKFTEVMSTSDNTFIYTGLNFESSGSQNDVTLFNNIIEKASHIEQIENRLLLANVKGKDVDLCKLQKYASKITADMVIRPVVLTEIDSYNPKNPSVHHEGTGYMPGEIYSFGVVWIYEDNTTTPVFHIPGRSSTTSLTTTFTPGNNVYPMAVNNTCEDTQYLSNNNCSSGSMWGVDYEGVDLEGKAVRHHRFPLRTDHNIPFVEKVEGTLVSNYVKRIKIGISGDTTLLLPVVCEAEGSPLYDAACVPTYVPPFSLEIGYIKDTVSESYTTIIDPNDWALDGDQVQGTTTDTTFSSTLVGTVITLDTPQFYEVDEHGTKTLLTGTTVAGVFTSVRSPKGIIYTVSLVEASEEFKKDIYTSNLFGIRFSNVEMPTEADLNGNKIIGYYIVRNERKESDRTIVDSAVLASTMTNKNFVGSGLLYPEVMASPVSTLKGDILTMINPEFKFNDVNFTNFSKITQQGNFNKIEAIRSRVKVNDVLDGTGYVSGKHKKGESDEDGFSLHIKTRDNLTQYTPSTSFILDSTNIKQIFYLPALGDKVILDSTEKSVDVFNLACDNKVGIISLKQDFTTPIITSLPYVYLERENINPYSTFRLTPYYKESQNPVYFGNDVISTTDIWNGDSYMSSMRYVNSIFYDNRMKQRAGKTSAWSYIAAGLLIVAAVLVEVFSFGVATVGAVALAGLAASLVGVATALTLSGLKQDAWNKAYNQLYKEGLRETITDNYILNDTDPVSHAERGFKKNPQDDEIQWFGECANLWFESSVNIALRHGATDNTPDFLDAPGNRQLGTTAPEWDREYFDIHSVGSGKEDIVPTTSLDSIMLKKLTTLDSNRKSNKSYTGVAAAEMYLLNADYKRRNKQKTYNHLGIEYDCCSDCNETFPHRWHWSEQAFQEELTDNFRAFLPNNYKDLEGETGSITDIFRIQNNIYIHTEEGLWLCPQNIQERTTDNIVTFIGTGEYFNIPPRKIVDDSNSSAGTIHKWGRLKTKHGILFPSYKEKKWYLFDGQNLQPITDSGMFSYFKNSMDFDVLSQYYNANLSNYPYNNNPSNSVGVGYLSTYDTNKERFLITKKDQTITNLPAEDYQICSEGGTPVIFEDFSTIVADKANDGWEYKGMENCQLKFSKIGYRTVTSTVIETVTLPNTAVVHAFYDTSGSFGGVEPGGQLDQIKQSVIAWYTAYRPDDILDVNGESTLLKHHYDSTERWLHYASVIPAGGDVLVLTFVNEANSVYHTNSLTGTVSTPTATYIADYNQFVNTTYPSFTSFKGINYPIVTASVSAGEGLVYLQHVLAAIKGRDWTLDEVNALEVNTAFSPPNWTLLKSSLLDNPYVTLVDGIGDSGLEKYFWQFKSNKNDLGTAATLTCPASTEIISPCQFSEDINSLLASSTETTETEVSIQVPEVIYSYVAGVPFTPQVLDNSFTLSFSLKTKQWVSWHSYLPSFYIHVQEKFYSWKQGLSSIYKHNKKGSYGTFYGEHKPFIVEYVDNSNPLQNKVYDHVLFQSEAKKYIPSTKEYIDQRNVTFNKVLMYNTQQISGVLNLVPKQNEAIDYLIQQTKNVGSTTGSIPIDRNERDWTFNDLRDLRVDYTVPMFYKDVSYLQSSYYIDKIVNPAAISVSKDWTQLESFRDKFLVIRLIFDTFADTRLIFNFSVTDKKVSER